MALHDAARQSTQQADASQHNLAGDTHEQGMYFNVDTARQDFVNVFIDTGGDPFSVLTDPLKAGFKIFWHFDAKSGLLADEKYTNSALAYLKRIGQNHRYELLKTFIETLSKVSSYSPWIFQSIDGIKEMYDTPFEELRFRKQLNIHCLETVDWRISALATMYREITHDHHRKVEIIPVNLRRFSMSVYVYDFRVFTETKTNLELLQTVQNQDVKKLNHQLFDIGYCEFDISSGNSIFDTVSNIDLEPKNNNLIINFENYVHSGLFRAITGDQELNAMAFAITQAATTGATAGAGNFSFDFDKSVTIGGKEFGTDRLPIVQTAQEILNNLIDTDNWKRQLGQSVDYLASRLADRINGELTGLFLGNVHSFDPSDLVRLGESESFNETFQKIYSATEGNASLRFGDDRSTDLGNVYD